MKKIYSLDNIYHIRMSCVAKEKKNSPIIILEKCAGIYRETYNTNILIYGKDYVARSMACEYVSLCTKVPAVACGLYPCVSWKTEEERFLGKAPQRKRLGDSLYSHTSSNRKNVITERIKVRETTSVTRLRLFRRRCPRPDAEFKYRRKYSAFDSRNCCIRHLFPSLLPLKDSFVAVAFSSCKRATRGS